MKKILFIVLILFLNISLFGEEIVKVGLSDGEILVAKDAGILVLTGCYLILGSTCKVWHFSACLPHEII